MSGSCNGTINIIIPQQLPTLSYINIDAIGELTPTTSPKQLIVYCNGKDSTNNTVSMTCPSLTYSSSNSSLISVSQSGLVNGLQNGNATITVSGGGKSAWINIISNVIPTSPTSSTIIQRYDSNHDGILSKSEAITAVLDYFSGIITKAEAIQVVLEYFRTGGTSDPALALNPASDGSTPIGTQVCLISLNWSGTIKGWNSFGKYTVYYTSQNTESYALPSELKLGPC